MFGLALPLIILQVYDRIIPNVALETFSLMIIGLITVAIFEGVLRIARSYVISWSAARFTKAITQDLIAKFLYAPTGAFSETLDSKTIEKLGNINKIADFYGGQSRLMFVDLPFAFVFLCVMGLIGGWLAVVPFAILCFFGVATIAASRSFKILLEKKEEHEARIYDFVAETLNGLLTMKAQSCEPAMMRRFERLQTTNAQLHYGIITTAINGQTIAGLLGNGTMIAMVSTGAILAVHGQMTIGVLACCTLLSGRAVQPILRVASTWNDFQSARLAVSEISKFFELNHVPEGEIKEKLDRAPSIQASDLEVSDTLNNANFTIESGELIAVVAPDGSGKSSLLRAITGMGMPKRGEVKISGKNAFDFRRSNEFAVGLSSEYSEAFVGSIFDNISLYGNGPSAESVRWAVSQLKLDRDIDRLPDGYDTRLAQGIAETLPSGFIKRLLLARILAQSPTLWVIDEPQNGLDDVGQNAVLEALETVRGTMTIIYSTHSEKFIRSADRIMVFVDGDVRFYDSYDDFRRDPEYINSGMTVTDDSEAVDLEEDTAATGVQSA